MNHRKIIARGITLILVMIMLAGCTAPAAAPTAATCPTSASQSCPTAAAQAMPEISGFRWSMAGLANAIITFEPGDKCSMQVVSQVKEGEGLVVDLVAKDHAYQNYIVWISYLDPGTTLEDMKNYTDPINPPSWLNIIGAVMATPMSRAFYADMETIDAARGPIYFTCQVEGPVARKFIDQLGPLEIKPAP